MNALFVFVYSHGVITLGATQVGASVLYDQYHMVDRKTIVSQARTSCS